MLPAVISKIISMQPSFTMSENEICQYVINNAESVIYSTISNVAKETNTSEASINRFCKKIGYKGFNGLKIALAQETFYNNMKRQSMPEVNNGLIATVTRDYNHMLQNTSAMLEESVINNIVECIKKVDQIYIFALSNHALIAQQLEFKLNDVGINAKTYSDVVRMRIGTANIGKNDLAIIIAPTIMMRDIYYAVNTCKDQGAKIATITSYDSPKLNDLVDFKFITSDKITTHNSVSLSNNMIYLYVIDVIYSALLQSDKVLLQRKLNCDAIMNNAQMMDNYLLDY